MPVITKVPRAVTFRAGFPHVNVAGESRRIPALLSDGDGNTKLRKNSGKGFLTVGLSLAPSNESGIGNTCPHASAGCKSACLDHQGLASVFTRIRAVRIAKTVIWYREREWFLTTLREELTRHRTRAEQAGFRLAVRLNVFSDIPWEKHGIISEFPDVSFYDYTKNPRRTGQLAPNYWVTFSRSETNQDDCIDLLLSGGNVAVVFADMSGKHTGNRSGLQNLPSSWQGFEVIDGDTTDLRFDDPRGRTRGKVVGLRLKAHSNFQRQGAIDSGFAVKFRSVSR